MRRRRARSRRRSLGKAPEGVSPSVRWPLAGGWAVTSATGFAREGGLVVARGMPPARGEQGRYRLSTAGQCRAAPRHVVGRGSPPRPAGAAPHPPHSALRAPRIESSQPVRAQEGRGSWREGALRATEAQVARQRSRHAAAPSAAHRGRQLVAAGRWPPSGERPHDGVGSSPRGEGGGGRRPRGAILVRARIPLKDPHAPTVRCQSAPVQPTCWNHPGKADNRGSGHVCLRKDRAATSTRSGGSGGGRRAAWSPLLPVRALSVACRGRAAPPCRPPRPQPPPSPSPAKPATRGSSPSPVPARPPAPPVPLSSWMARRAGRRRMGGGCEQRPASHHSTRLRAVRAGGGAAAALAKLPPPRVISAAAARARGGGDAPSDGAPF